MVPSLVLRTVCTNGACTLQLVKVQQHLDELQGDHKGSVQLRKETKGLGLGRVGAIFPLLTQMDALLHERVEYPGELCSPLMGHKDMWGFHVPWTFLSSSTSLFCFGTTPGINYNNYSYFQRIYQTITLFL